MSNLSKVQDAGNANFYPKFNNFINAIGRPEIAGTALIISVVSALFMTVGLLSLSAPSHAGLTHFHHLFKPIGYWVSIPLAFSVFLIAATSFASARASKAQSLETQESLKKFELAEIQKKLKSNRTVSYSNPIENGNCDFSYVDQEKGMALVFDGYKHNRLDIAEPSAEILSRFIYQYKAPRTSFEDLAQAKAWFVEAFSEIYQYCWGQNNKKVELGNDELVLFWDASITHGMTLVQIVKINEESHALFMQFSDTMALIKKAGGSIDWLDQQYLEGTYNEKIYLKPRNAFDRHALPEGHVYTAKVERGDTLVLFTDGIGEYFLKEELEELVRNSSNEQELLQNSFDKLSNAERMHKIQRIKEDEKNIPDRNDQTLAANNNRIMNFDPENSRHSDDMSAAFLQV